MIDIEEVVDFILETVEESDSMIILLGGACDTDQFASDIASDLRNEGIRFTHSNDQLVLPKAVYVIAVPDAKYSDYQYARGSEVIDPFGVVQNRPGVTVHRVEECE